jgi:carbon monoxide dehydrogenase subunit G
MKVVGEARLRGPVESVWAALHDAAALGRAIPGCEQFEVSGPGLAQFIATTALPAISGTYAAKLTIAEQQPPDLLKLTVAASGDRGTIAADVTLWLTDAADPVDAATLVSYEASGTVTGSIAGVGTRLLISAAKRLAAEFLASIDDRRPQPVLEPAAEVRPAGGLVAPARRRPWADHRGALAAGAAIGLAGLIVGVLVGRRSRWTGRVRA